MSKRLYVKGNPHTTMTQGEGSGGPCAPLPKSVRPSSDTLLACECKTQASGACAPGLCAAEEGGCCGREGLHSSGVTVSDIQTKSNTIRQSHRHTMAARTLKLCATCMESDIVWSETEWSETVWTVKLYEE